MDRVAAQDVLHVLQLAGIKTNDSRVAPWLGWLRTHQHPSEALQGNSGNEKRRPESADPEEALAGEYMWDAASAYTVLGLSHDD
jgi:hypothetical protein